MGKKAVHFGAGNIGRGFVACFLHNSGYEVVFADVVDSLIDKINATPSYKVIEVGVEGTTEQTITNYRAINSKTHEEDLIEELRTADIATCSVGPNILKFIAPVLAKAIDRRSEDANPLHVIACENAIGATDTLAQHIKDPTNTDPARLETHHLRARYANSAIDRIVPAQDPNAGLDVKLEKFFEWVVDRTPFEDLFTVNTGHATAAYGYNRRKRTVYDALQDKDIMAEHGIDEQQQTAYVEKIIKRIANPHLEDAVERLAEKGQSIKYLLDAVEMCFRFQNVEEDEESKELAKIMSESKPEDIVAKVCGVQTSEKIYPQLVEVSSNKRRPGPKI
ncbi:mannitol dehydrogenase rossmann domain-containing protein [Hirsutella rhossiliensis]|uniref:Mannitol dehydrogenase rossmann domain-containing protein n=1 Tax=Hirsutella rhossiliensis TaxID=111463 RepID=A0A9P8MKS2_9HYPO|nr:mannitol dehydrogenase rossmann domain-containing protein [Hirsutella rhossiliensis]KAH0956950.1 mannitol dehydrogenase rossmann domain-containing protein [Hirsutella rhossiliensis]